MRASALLVTPLLLAALVPSGLALSTGPTPTQEFLVGYAEGDRDAALASVEMSGGVLLREATSLRVLLVGTGEAARFATMAASLPGVLYVETNDPIRAAGTQWNGAEWNGAEWNGVEWDGTQWNGAEWNGAEWNAQQGAPAKANDPGRTLQWGLAAVKAPAAWATTMGTRGADVCVLDSGIAADHRDLAPNLWKGPGGAHGWNVIDRNADVSDGGGHGTHVAGIAAAAVGNGWGVAGVGNVRVMAVKVLGADGKGTEADLAFGLAWCADHDAEVALMALSADKGPTLDRALAYADARDVLLTASAGNQGCDCVGYPARDPLVVAVTAVGRDLQPAPFTSRGAQAELAAPGVDVLSTFPGGRFVYGSGTSQAAAFVAGAAALLRDANPELSARQAREHLAAGAKDLGAPGRDPAYGHGLLDVDAAIRRAG